MSKYGGSDTSEEHTAGCHHIYNDQCNGGVFCFPITYPRVGHGEQETDITGHFAVFFFNDGIVAYNFYARKDDISEYMPAFKGIIDSVTFDKGYEYKSGLFEDALIRKSAIVAGLLIALALLFRYIWVKKRTEANAVDKRKG